MFACDLGGDQHLQIWVLTADLLFQSEVDDFPLTPSQARGIIAQRRKQNARPYWVAFPYTPYLEPNLMKDWVRLNYAN